MRQMKNGAAPFRSIVGSSPTASGGPENILAPVRPQGIAMCSQSSVGNFLGLAQGRLSWVSSFGHSQFRLMPNLLKRFDSDVSLAKADAYQLALDPRSLAVTENRRAETSEHEEKFGQLGRMTCHLEPSTSFGYIDQKTIARPCPVDRHRTGFKRVVEFNPTRALSALVAHHHANLLGFRRFRHSK
jgi:hypothetical protein